MNQQRNPIAFDDMIEGMVIEWESDTTIEGPARLVDVDLEGGWADTDDGSTVFRDGSWTFYELAPTPLPRPPRSSPGLVWWVAALILVLIVRRIVR